MTKVNKQKITAEEFDAKAEAGENVSEFFDADSGTKRFNVDMPIWALRELDAEATRRGITRQSLVKGWLIDQLDALRKQQDQRKAV